MECGLSSQPVIELPPHDFIKEPLNITHEFDLSDPISLEIPVGTPLMFTKAYSRYSAVAGNTSYAFVGTIEVNGKSYPVEWLWDKGESEKAVFEKNESLNQSSRNEQFPK